MKVSIVIPAYNEEKHIEKVLRKLKKLKEVGEIIVVDDGSTDKTAVIAERHAKVVSYGENKGKGYAMRYGASRASYDYVVFFEGDDQLYVEDVKKAVALLESGCDLVFGVRDLGVIPWPRRVNNVLTTLALFLATGRIIRDPLSGFMGADKRKFLNLRLKEDRFNIECEIRFKAVKNKLKYCWFPERVKYHEKKAFKFNKLGWRQSALIIAFLVKLVLVRRV